MKKLQTPLLPFLTLFLFNTSCITYFDSNCSKNTTETYSEDKALQALQKNEINEATDQYVQTAALLFKPDTIEASLTLLQKAIEIEPKNTQAHFLISLVEPISKLRGVLTKIEPALETKEKHALNKLREQLSTYNQSKLLNFLNNPPQGSLSAQTYSDLQDYLKQEILPSLVKAEQRLEEIENAKPFSIQLDLSFFGIFSGEKAKSDHSECKEVNGRWECQATIITACNAPPIKGINIDSVDIKTAKAWAATIANSIRVSTAYRLDGGKEIHRNLRFLNELAEKKRKKVSTQKTVSVIQKQKDFAVLDNNHELEKIPYSIEKVLSLAMDFYSSYDVLCKTNERSMNFVQSICINFEMGNSIQEVLELLSGPKEIHLGHSNKEKVTVLMDIQPLFFQTPHDLKDLLPTAFDPKEGLATEYPDPTFGQIFPNGDLIEKLNKTGKIRLPREIKKVIK